MRHFSKFTSIFALAFTTALGAGCATGVDEPTEETEVATTSPEESTEVSSEALTGWGDDDDDCDRYKVDDGWYEYRCDESGGNWWDDDDDAWWYDSHGRRRNDRCDRWDCDDDDWVRLRRHSNRHHDNGRHGRFSNGRGGSNGRW